MEEFKLDNDFTRKKSPETPLPSYDDNKKDDEGGGCLGCLKYVFYTLIIIYVLYRIFR